MARWFRLYDDVLNDPKVQRLPDRLFKAWINILCLASTSDGVLPSNIDVAFALRMTEVDARQMMLDLMESGLVDAPDGDGHRRPHGWEKRQHRSDSSAERTKRYRDRLKIDECDNGDGHSDGHSDALEQNRAESEQNREEQKERRVIDRDLGAGGGFTSFWQSYPHKVGKREAEKAFAAIAKRGVKLDDLMVGLERYKRDKPPDRSWCNPSTWLNQDRYLDEPSKIMPTNGGSNGKRPDNSIAAALDRLDDFVAGAASTDIRNPHPRNFETTREPNPSPGGPMYRFA